MNEQIFKAYDIRGIYPTELDELTIYKIARAYCEFVKPKEVAVGSDVRLSSPSLKKAVIKAITDQKIPVVDVGTISTDMLYFAVAHYGYAGGLTVTASHNPKEYNGMKMVREGSRPISGDTGIYEIREIVKGYNFDESVLAGEINETLVTKKDILADYLNKVKSFADLSAVKNLKVVMNPNFGAAGKNLDKLLGELPIIPVKLNWEADGNFPKGRPDPLIPANREEISRIIVEEKADLGVAWDADADRCFFFTEKGEFIEGYFITALLAKIFLEKNPGEKILHDTRLTWAIDDMVKNYGGEIIQAKAGHAFIKERMRKDIVLFGGEMSAHYYFRDYFFCDNGLIPFVMILEFLSKQNKTFSEIMNELFWQKYFVLGENNFEVKNIPAFLEEVEEKYADGRIDKTDGVSIEYPDWRFNLRGSNTEPVIRLNLEAKSAQLLEEKKKELFSLFL